MAEMIAVIEKFGSPTSKPEYFLGLSIFQAFEAQVGRQAISSFDELGNADYKIIVAANHRIATELNRSYWGQKIPGIEVTP